MSNVVIKKAVAGMNIDSYNRSAVATVDLDNGSIFKLGAYSTTAGEDEVFTAVAPATGALNGMWMATSPEVVITKVGNVEYKGLTPDPRQFVNLAGKIIDATYLAVGDIITMSCDGIADVATSAFLNAVADSFELVAGATQTASATSLKKLGTDTIAIGNERVAGYKFEVVAN